MENNIEKNETDKKEHALMMTRLEEMNLQLDEMAHSVRSVKRYMLVTLIVSVAVVVLPLMGLIFMIPYLFSTFSSMYKGF
ncbi:MAG: hypothetical protein V1652_01800 [bacterium]